MRIVLAGTLATVATVVATPGTARAGCADKADFQVLSALPLKYSYDYRACDVPDLDQVRKTSGSTLGVTNNGVLYCVPTSTMDWLVHLAKLGFVSKPDTKDWTKASNFSEMSSDIEELAGDMGTDPYAGTLPPSKMLTGVDTWLTNYGTPQVSGGAGLVVEKLFVSGGEYSVEPSIMALDAVGGALVVAGISFWDSGGTQQGGHYVALKEISGKNTANDVTFGVRDPYTDSTKDAVQTAYATDDWTVSNTLTSGRGYKVSGVPYASALGYSMYFSDYLSIEPKKLLTVFGVTLVWDPPRSLLTGRPIPPLRARVPGRRRVLDVALSPEGALHPLLLRGSNAVWQFNRLTGGVTKLADGPRRPAHLAVGGPAMTLFVAGARQLVAFDRRGRRVATARLAQPLDALAFSPRTDRLVGLSAKSGRLTFFSRDLHPAGGVTLPESFTRAHGRPTLAVGPAGELLLHRDGSDELSTADAGTQARAARAFPLVRLQSRRLHAGAAPRGLAVDDDGHVFVSVAGRVVELDADGNPVAGSAYAGVRAGSLIRIDRAFSNAPAGGPARDFVSDELLSRLPG
jgi:hypothetical protein